MVTGWLGRAFGVALIVAAGAMVFSAPLAAQSEPPAPSISSGQADSLVKSALIALDNANKTGNYTVLFDLGSPSFRAVNSLSRLAAIFADLRRRDLDLSALAALSPSYMKPPYIDKKGLLNLVGHMQAGRLRINFDIVYQRTGKGWRLAGLAVGAADAVPVAALARAKPAVRDSETAPPAPAKVEAAPGAEKAPSEAAKPVAGETAKLRGLMAEKYEGRPAAVDEASKPVPEKDWKPASEKEWKPAGNSPSSSAKAGKSGQPPLTAPLPMRRPALKRAAKGAASAPAGGDIQPLTLSGAPPPIGEPKPGYLRRMLQKITPVGRGDGEKTPE